MPTNYSGNFRYQPIENAEIDPFRPMQFTETLKDAVVLELRRFFDLQEERGLLQHEIPTIEKYRIADPAQGEQPFLQQVNVIRQLPDVMQKLPILAITTATGRTQMMGVGTIYVGVVQEPPRLVTSEGPWNIPPNTAIAFRTKLGVTRFMFTEAYFADMANAQPQEVVNAINSQSDRIYAYTNPAPNSSITIQLKTPELEFIEVVTPTGIVDYGGTVGEMPPAYGFLTVDVFNLSGVPLGGDTVNGTTLFGLTVGQSDDVNNPARPPFHRYGVHKEMVLNIDVGSDSDNGRTEMTDLVSYYFDVRLEEQDFSINGNPAKGQNFQIITRNELVLAGESEIPRPEGDGMDKIYVNRISVPVTFIDYVDRPAVRVTGTTYQPALNPNADD